MRTSHNARLLFLVSGDYGELSNALYFIRGQNFASRTTLLLPSAVYALNTGALPVSAREYTSVQDVVDEVKAWQPDIVFLFSGYLYTVNGLLSIESLEVLIRVLRGTGCRIVTSDPFLGALADAETAEELGRIHRPFLRAFELLRDAVHFYPTPCNHLGGQLSHVSVFNPSFDRTSADDPDSRDSTRAFWLFVLSGEDYKVQVAKHGASAFADQVIRMLRGTRAHGRRAIFIGPQPCIDSINARLPATDGIELHGLCAHELFTSLVLGAEHAFYWNMFSNSIVLRLGSGLTTFFFDIGHLGKLYELAVENYFLGWRPVCLDPRQEMSAALLGLMSRLSHQHRERIRAHYRSAPSPEQAIATLLQGQPA